MFIRAAIEESVSEVETLPHEVSVLSPDAYEIRPRGFRPGEPSYRVLVERAAFRVRALVTPDYLAGAIVAAVVAGGHNNPRRLERLTAEIASLGWEGEIELTPSDFRLAARSPATGDDEEITSLSARVAVTLSEFVLDQLVVTRAVGEMRPAVDRAVMTESASEVWLYDPSERDRSTQVHRSLENWLISRLRESAVEPLDAAGEPYFDLAWRVGATLHVCEVKSSARNETHQLRLGLGQILQYRRQLEADPAVEVRGSLLIEAEPLDRRWLDVCDASGILLFWPALWDVVSRQLLEA